MIYLDYAATTKPSPAAIAALERSFEFFGNPSSLHKAGIAAEAEMSNARAAIAKIIGAKTAEIYFTASGTEANNLAIFGGAKKHKGRKIATSQFEHSSVAKPLAQLAAKGDFDICYDEDYNEAALVTVAHVESNTGEIRDIYRIGQAVKKANPATLFHVDAAQSFCKLPINVNSMNIDLLTLSAHKVGGLKGLGALYVRSGISLTPQIYGGGQEQGLRSGTENTHGIMAFAASANDFWANSTAHHAHVSGLKACFLEIMDEAGGIGISINGGGSPYILSLSIEGVKAHILLNALSAEGVYVSTGSACSTKKQHKAGDEAIRLSFAPETTFEEIETAKEKFLKCIKQLRPKI